MSKSMSRFAIPAHTMLILGSCRFSGSPDQDRFGMRPELYAWGAEFWSGLTHRTRSWFLSVSVRHIKVLADGDERLFRLGILEAKMCPLIGALNRPVDFGSPCNARCLFAQEIQLRPMGPNDHTIWYLEPSLTRMSSSRCMAGLTSPLIQTMALAVLVI